MSRYNAGNTWYAILQNALNTMSKGHLRHRAALAGTLELYGYYALFIHVNQLNIAVSLKRRTNKFKHCGYIRFFYHWNLQSFLKYAQLFF